MTASDDKLLRIYVRNEKVVPCKEVGIDDDGMCHVFEIVDYDPIDFIDKYLTDEEQTAAYGYGDTNVSKNAANVYAILLARAGVLPIGVEEKGRGLQAFQG